MSQEQELRVKKVSLQTDFINSYTEATEARTEMLVLLVLLLLESANRSWQAFLSILVFGGFHVAFVTL